MQKHFLKFGKVFTNVACTPLILISNNSELAAKYLPSDYEQSIKNLEITDINKLYMERGLANGCYFDSHWADCGTIDSLLETSVLMQKWNLGKWLIPVGEKN